MKEAKIDVSFKEAFAIGATLKVAARRLQKLADHEQQEGDAKKARLYYERSASHDAFADKLYEAFLTPDKIEKINESADD